MADFISLPFYDLFHENRHVPRIRKNLPELLTGVRQSILEIGAGTGLITTSIAEWTPAEIFALEPSYGMRGVLLARLNARPELLDRVTVLPYDALSLDLEEPVEAMVMINVMYAMEPDYRRSLWPVLASHLRPGGLLVFTRPTGGTPPTCPLTELDSRRVGRHTYTMLWEVQESNEESAKIRYVHRITQGDKVISEEEHAGYGYLPTHETIMSELTPAGFTPADAPEGLLAWRLT